MFFSKNKLHQSDNLIRLINDEKKLQTNTIDNWKNFGSKSIEHAKKLSEIVNNFTTKDRIIAYGASARSSTLLNFTDISSKQIEFVIDRNPLKHNLYTPGTDIPIVSFKEGLKKGKEKNILLLWNFENEIVKDLQNSGLSGKIIIPLPNR